MSGLYFVTIFTMIVLFILFLVISRTLNSVVNYLTRIDFLISTERDFRAEELEVRRVLFEGIGFGDEKTSESGDNGKDDMDISEFDF